MELTPCKSKLYLSILDGAKYGISYKVSEDGERLVGVDYDPVSETTPVTAINSYAELAALATEQGSGFTIETLRYVNAYQNSWNLTCVKVFHTNKSCKVVGILIFDLMNFSCLNLLEVFLANYLRVS